jgi:hypothetical protein
MEKVAHHPETRITHMTTNSEITTKQPTTAEPWIIQDWTGKRCYMDRTFSSFTDAWAFLCEQHPEAEDRGEFCVTEHGVKY